MQGRGSERTCFNTHWPGGAPPQHLTPTWYAERMSAEHCGGPTVSGSEGASNTQSSGVMESGQKGPPGWETPPKLKLSSCPALLGICGPGSEGNSASPHSCSVGVGGLLNIFGGGHCQWAKGCEPDSAHLGPQSSLLLYSSTLQIVSRQVTSHRAQPGSSTQEVVLGSA